MNTSTLLLRLEGPTQGWGSAASRWDYRTSEHRPTKSGLIGLVANALGRDYADQNDDLTILRFGIRADRPGHLEHDFRVAGGGTFPLDALTAWNNPKLTASPTGRINYGAPRASKNNAWTDSAREGVMRPFTFLADSGFLAALTGPQDTLEAIAAALERPARLVSLGRRADPPAHPLMHSLCPGDHHSDWGSSAPLLETATTVTPVLWEETTTPGPHDIITYEQPPAGAERGHGHGAIALTRYTVHPPLTENAA